MRLFRRIIVSIAIVALVGGSMPLSLALGCVPRAAPAAAPSDHAGGKTDTPDAGNVCIHYPAPQAPGSLAIFEIAAPLVGPAVMFEAEPAPPAAVPTREEPPATPPPR